MKIPYVIGLVVAAALVTFAIQESRISELRRKLKSVETPVTPKTVASLPAASEEAPAAPARTKSRTGSISDTPAKEPASEVESFAKTARQMWDNPAGKSMMNQGAKMAVAVMYQEFIDGLNLTKEESDYFKNLLGKEVSDQQELGMKMLGATKAEQTTLVKELEKRASESEAEIKKFLNSEEDIKAFTDYKNHLPERQQLDGIRTAMSAGGVPLDSETETKLVDAMYRSRTEANLPDLSGQKGLEELAKGNIMETFEKSWDVQQQALQAETSRILNEAQQKAFHDYQKQAKEMQLMGLKMAEQMMGGKKEEGQ
ncbi:MAG: hypothetical protein ACRCXD_13900 [Luteolibacter sp.]